MLPKPDFSKLNTFFAVRAAENIYLDLIPSLNLQKRKTLDFSGCIA